MIRTDSLKFRFLELVAICGEFPSEQLPRLIRSPSYAEKVITDLKKEKLIRTHYKDSIRGYRLTKRGKELLLQHNPGRFQSYLNGNRETNQVRSEPARRNRLHRLSETYLTLIRSGIPIFPDEKPRICAVTDALNGIPESDLPLFYSARELKDAGAVTTKIKNSRSMGILLASGCIYVIYNTGNTVLKWEHRTEVRLNAFLQHYFKGQPYHGHPKIRAVMLGNDIETAYRLMTSTGGYRQSFFRLDTTFSHFHYLPNNDEGESLLRILSDSAIKHGLDLLLLSDLEEKRDEFPVEHDAFSKNGAPVLLAYDFDMQRINRFNAGLNVYDMEGELVCFDFQIPVLRQYVPSSVHFSSINLVKFRKAFLNEEKMDETF